MKNKQIKGALLKQEIKIQKLPKANLNKLLNNHLKKVKQIKLLYKAPIGRCEIQGLVSPMLKYGVQV